MDMNEAIEEGVEIDAVQDETFAPDDTQSYAFYPESEISVNDTYYIDEYAVEEGVEVGEEVGEYEVVEEVVDSTLSFADYMPTDDSLSEVSPEETLSCSEYPEGEPIEESPEGEQYTEAVPDAESDEPISDSAAVSQIGNNLRNSSTGEIVRSGSSLGSETNESLSAETESFYEFVKEYLSSNDYSFDDLYQETVSLNENVVALNDNVVIAAQNEALYFKYIIGASFAIFGAILVYVAFSKFS